MSIAPANSASIAVGPALKLFQSILTFGPMAFSKYPFAFPTMAWGWVMLGNAPTWITVWANAWPKNERRKPTTRTRLFISSPVRISVDYHGQDFTLLL